MRYDADEGWSTGTVQHLGEEWIYLLAGTVAVEIAGRTEIMEADDAVHFDAWAPHRLATPDTGASLLLVTTGPGTNAALSKGARSASGSS